MQPPTRAFDQKQIATTFLKLAASGKVSEAFAQYISADFRHHNPYFPGDAKSLKAGMMEAHQKFPSTTLEVQHTFAEDDLVAVHSRVRHSADTPEIAVVHIFRFENRRIAEMWDIGIEAPKNSPNDNGLF
ncbi:MAG TPA: nuclear transport factor 2 family protein [Pyrinomonadaceae bacterium]|nr:nuclear transport factor 2 family protein [Pyrinomonadaceae bacterium]